MGRQKGLGELEQQVLEFLWANGPSTGDVVRSAVGQGRPLADSTIRTVLRRLEAKHFVRHDLDGPKFLYLAVHEPRKVATDAVLQVLRKFCRGSLEEMLTGLVDHDVVDSAELKRLAARIEAHEKRQSAVGPTSPSGLRRGKKS